MSSILSCNNSLSNPHHATLWAGRECSSECYIFISFSSLFFSSKRCNVYAFIYYDDFSSYICKSHWKSWAKSPLEGHQEEEKGKRSTWGQGGDGAPLFAAPAAQLLLQLLPCRWLKVSEKAGPKVAWRDAKRNRMAREAPGAKEGMEHPRLQHQQPQLLPCRWLKVIVKAGPKVAWRGAKRNRMEREAPGAKEGMEHPRLQHRQPNLYCNFYHAGD